MQSIPFIFLFRTVFIFKTIFQHIPSDTFPILTERQERVRTVHGTRPGTSLRNISGCMGGWGGV